MADGAVARLSFGRFPAACLPYFTAILLFLTVTDFVMPSRNLGSEPLPQSGVCGIVVEWVTVTACDCAVSGRKTMRKMDMATRLRNGPLRSSGESRRTAMAVIITMKRIISKVSMQHTTQDERS
mgnify:CR=1 FL=1